MEPIEQPDHSAITRRVERIRNYLKSTLATEREAYSVFYRKKNESDLDQERRKATSEHDTRWKYSDDSDIKQKNWHVFGQFSDTNLCNS
jgi:hypothetical protein